MEPVTLEQVQAGALSLSVNEQHLLRALLDASLHQPEQARGRSIEEIAREQGKRPVSFQELLGPEPVENDADDVDAFLADLRQWRTDSSVRELD